MALHAGDHVGPYEILGSLGAGGMGEVYRARDPRLGRAVAIKVLPASVSADATRRRRFEHEARTTGILNHPSILVVYEVGDHGGAPYLVTELLEGETLRERLRAGAIPARKAVEYARQVAHGLAAAHGKAVVHRDLKPENLFLTKDGVVKILDFGLALQAVVADDGDTRSPTLTRETGPGVVLGTVGYMSPEQARGETADHRSDVFSLGAVLYEMLTGRRAFHGDTAVETLNAILRQEPEDFAPELKVPPSLDRVVRHCLEKKREDRFQSARDVAFALETLGSGSQSVTVAAPRAPASGHRRWLLGATVGSLALAALTGVFFAGRRSASPGVPHYRQITFGRGLAPSGRFTPDGRAVVYSAAWNGGPPEIHSLAIAPLESKPIGLPHGHVAAISAKGELAMLLTAHPYHLQRPATLARVPLSGGVPRPVAEDVWCADWAPDGESLAVCRAEGGQNQVEFPLGRVLARGQVFCPRFSPDGRRLAWSVPEGYEVFETAGERRFRITGVSELGHEMWWAWSPKGDEIWVTASDEGNERPLRALSMNGRQRLIERVAGTMTLYDLSREGRALVEHGFAWWHVLARPPGGPERDLSLSDHTFVRDLSADGRSALLSEWGTSGGAPVAYLRPTDGSPAMRLGRGSGCALSPDGRHVLVLPELTSVPYKTWGPTPLVVVPTGAGPQREVPLPGLEVRWAAWLPDGERLLVTAREERKGVQVFVVGIDGSGRRAVTPEGVFAGLKWDSNPKPVTDGRHVAAPGPGGRLTLYPLDGAGPPREVPGVAPGFTAARFASDGRSLIVVGPEDTPTRLYRVELETGRRTLLHELAPEDRAGVATYPEAVVTPDGRGYAYEYARVFHKLFVVEGLK